MSGRWGVRRKPRAEDHAVPLNERKPSSSSRPDNVPEDDFVALWEEIPSSEIPLDEKLAEGPNASVYKTSWCGDFVIVKQFRVTPEEQPIDKELNNLCRLRSPYLLLVMGACTMNSPFSIITEYMNKGDLKQFLTEGTTLSVPQITRLAVDIIKGLAFLHTRGFVHRGIKPSNILISGERDSFRAKIADTGVSCLLAKSCRGSPPCAYMAPEALRDIASAGPEADIFSFGFILYELVHGKNPFTEMPASQAKEAILYGKRPELSTSVHPALRDIIQKCWTQQPKDRPSAEAIFPSLVRIK